MFWFLENSAGSESLHLEKKKKDISQFLWTGTIFYGRSFAFSKTWKASDIQKNNSPRVTPGLNHNKCSHFSSQTPLEVFNFLTNGAWGLPVWTSELPDLSFAGADCLWKTGAPWPEASTEVSVCFYVCFIISLLSLPIPLIPRPPVRVCASNTSLSMA